MPCCSLAPRSCSLTATMGNVAPVGLRATKSILRARTDHDHDHDHDQPSAGRRSAATVHQGLGS